MFFGKQQYALAVHSIFAFQIVSSHQKGQSQYRRDQEGIADIDYKKAFQLPSVILLLGVGEVVDGSPKLDNIKRDNIISSRYLYLPPRIPDIPFLENIKAFLAVTMTAITMLCCLRNYYEDLD